MALFDWDNHFQANPATVQNTQYDPANAQLNAQQEQQNNNGNIQAQAALAQHLMMINGGPTGAQNAYSAQLQQQAAGQGPSLAQAQLSNATGQNASMAAGQAASVRGLNPAMQARMAAQGQVQANQQAAGQSAMLRAGEQQQAMGAIGQQANTVANQGIQTQLQQGQLAGGVLQGIGSQNLSQQQTADQLFGQAATAQNAQNANNINNQNGTNSINSQTAQSNTNADAQVSAGIVNAGSQVLQTGLKAGMAAQGGYIPGHPAVAGAQNSYANDTVPAVLSPGEIVLPRSITQGDDPSGHAADFVAAIMRKQGAK